MYLRRAAETQLRLSEQYLDEEDDDEERSDRCVDLAEEALRESLQAENNFEAHIELAELLIGIEERLAEAEDHLQQARELISGPQDEAKIEHNLGKIAQQRGQGKEALSHYQRVVELLPEESEAWADLAQAHQQLGNLEEAETNYKQAIAVEPREAYYFTLSELYKTNNQLSKALDLLKEGLAACPDSAILHAYTAVTYLNSSDYDQAERYLDKAEEIDPQLDVIPTYRSLIALSKLEQMEEQTSHKSSRPLKRKGRRK